MSLVSQFQNKEVEATLRRQRRMATISSIAIAFLTLALLCLILAVIFLPALTKDIPVIVTYETPSLEDDPDDKPKVKTKVLRKPASPSASMARVITSNTVSPTSIPVPEFNTPEPSMEFGTDMDFGDAWGDGSGFGAGAGEATFFGQKVTAKRIAFVIDYSKSMGGERQKLMRKELKDTLKTLTNGMEFSLIFFAGPVWQGGDEIITGKKKNKGNPEEISVKAKGGKKFVWEGKSANSFKPASKNVQKMAWTKASSATVSKARRIVEDTNLVWGTIWDWPLKMALEMDPKPDVIYFMTDGSAGRNTVEIAEDMGRIARRKDIKINCIALMQPKAHDGLDELAKRSKGQFTIVLSEKRRKKVR